VRFSATGRDATFIAALSLSVGAFCLLMSSLALRGWFESFQMMPFYPGLSFVPHAPRVVSQEWMEYWFLYRHTIDLLVIQAALPFFRLTILWDACAVGAVMMGVTALSYATSSAPVRAQVWMKARRTHILQRNIGIGLLCYCWGLALLFLSWTRVLIVATRPGPPRSWGLGTAPWAGLFFAVSLGNGGVAVIIASQVFLPAHRARRRLEARRPRLVSKGPHV
jgi:hypothetical protein